MSQDEPNVVITMREVYDAVVELRGEVRELRGDHARSKDGHLDHESRIRDLEKWRYATTAALITALASLAGQLIQLLAK
ncbi:hypothetical protein [Actinomadura oligospora]|uniref:hypothetical protein n=1 Tax=Actinomadura oligospora TaxID=111804 RepID=UPI00047A78D5|nr:hypothetical protein [Actinomadura oligospora]